MKICRICRKPRADVEKVGSVEACGACAQSVREANAKAMEKFSKGFRRYMASRPKEN